MLVNNRQAINQRLRGIPSGRPIQLTTLTEGDFLYWSVAYVDEAITEMME